MKLVEIGRFDQPVYLTGPPGDPHRVFVVQKTGQIIVVVNGHARSRPFLDITQLVTSTGQEQGLLGLAFAPDYARSRPLLRLLHDRQQRRPRGPVPPRRS